MNYIIRADSSKQNGVGHVMRCLALAEEFIAQKHSVTFCYISMLPEMLERIEGIGAKSIIISGASDNEIGGQEDLTQTAAAAVEENAQAIIVDGYEFDENYLASLHKSYKLVFIDDQARLKNISADIIINSSPFAFEIAYEKLAPQALLLLGPDYTFLRREFRQQVSKLVPLKSRKNILVTFGGTDIASLSLPTVDNLLTSVAKGQVIDVVVSEHNENEFPQGVKVHKNSNNMAKLMTNAVVAISAGGGSLGELAFMQVPTLLVIVADNQAKHAGWAEKNGVNKVIDARGQKKEEIAKKIAKVAVDMMRNFDDSQQMLIKNRQLVDGNGVKRIVDEVLNIGVSS